MADKFKRITSEEALKIISSQNKGKLKVIVGYAPGVGKTFTMLNEGNRRLKRGEDVVIGYVETHQREETIRQIQNLEILPRKKVEYNGITMEEMDTDLILTRHPKVVLIDEIAHTNVPGSKNKKRYEDIEEILGAGIDVITTLNIQHLESLNDVIKQITGITVRETIPDYIVDRADEIVVADISPDALQNRLKRGNIYEASNIEQSLKNFFRRGNLNALRELSLRQTAEEVDEQLEEYMNEHDITDNWHTVERVMVCISSNPASKRLIRRGSRISKRYKCEWIVVNVSSTRRLLRRRNTNHTKVIEEYLELSKQLGAEVTTLTGKSVSEELSKFAQERHITQIIMGHANRSKLETLIRGSTVEKLLKKSKDIEIHIIPIKK